MVSQADLFLGVDGGGTGCRARLVDEAGQRLGEGRGGPANIRLSLETSWREIRTALDQALAEAGLDHAALPRIHAGLGLAGITGPADAARVVGGAPPFASIAAETDSHTACLGAFGGGDGAILIVGTGSVGCALVEGRLHQIGGWGFEVSDDGSGAQIGCEAVRASLRAHDGLGPASGLTDAIMARFGGQPAKIVAWVDGARPADYAALAPLVFEWGLKGDLAALPLIRRAAEHVDRFARRLTGLGAGRIAPMGGLAPVLAGWLTPWTRGLLAEPQGDAMDGAVLLARRRAGR